MCDYEKYEGFLLTSQTAVEIYIISKYSDKDDIKRLGGRWKTEVKKWYFRIENPKEYNYIHAFGFPISSVYFGDLHRFEEKHRTKLEQKIKIGNERYIVEVVEPRAEINRNYKYEDDY